MGDAPIVKIGSTTSRDFTKADKGKDLYSRAKSAVKLYASNNIFFHDVMRSLQKSIDQVTGQAVVDASRANTSTAEKRRRLSPGSFSIGATDYTNRPVIQVVKGDLSTSRSGEQPLGEFADFILSSVTEADVERTDVIETFGEPHIFTSGRFLRKVTFGGHVRTTSSNPTSTAAESRVPQHTLLRNFYERYMRSTAQAQFNYFTRIIVDGDIYEGYINSLNMARDAGTEMTMPFSITMLCLRRYHMNDNDAIMVLSRFRGETRRKLPPSFAAAEMRDAIGDFAVRLSLGNDEPTTSIEYNTGKVSSDGAVAGTAQVINLHAPYGGQTLTISGSGAETWSLTYDDGSDVSGSVSRAGKNRVHLKLKNYDKVLEQTEKSNNIATSDLIIKSSIDSGASLRISSTASDRPALKIMSLTLKLAGPDYPAESTIPAQNAFAVRVPNAHTLFTPNSGKQSLEFYLSAVLGTESKTLYAVDMVVIGNDVDQAISYNFGEVNPVRAGLISTNPTDLSLSAGGVDLGSSTSSVGPNGELEVGPAYIDLSTPTSVTSGNPFIMSDGIRFPVSFRFDVPNYQPVSGTLNVILDFGNPTLVSNVFEGGRGARSITPGRRWEMTSSGRDDVTGLIFFQKSESAKEQQINESDIEGITMSSVLRLQYNSGGVSCRTGFPTRSTLFINKQDVVVEATPTFVSSGDATALHMSVEFHIVSAGSTTALDTDAIKAELANPVAGILEFSPGLKLPPVQIRF